MNGIVSYGAYVPRYKIETGEIASVWGADGSAWAKNLNAYSKSVPGPDEDVITIAVEATRQAMKRGNLNGDHIGSHEGHVGIIHHQVTTGIDHRHGPTAWLINDLQGG